jgi:hypothetical protein
VMPYLEAMGIAVLASFADALDMEVLRKYL